MRISILSLMVTVALCACLPQAAPAGDFPGVGDPHAWSDALPYYNRGNRYLNQGRYEDAAKDFQEAVSRYEHDPDFYINLGVALRKIDDYTGAENAFKSAIKLNPKDWTAWSNLGNAYLKQNRLKDTVATFEKALQCNPPAADKAALLRDIADIHKILRATGQEPMPSAPKPPAAKVAQKGKKAAPPAKSVSGSAPVPGKPTPAPAKDWGYE
jgi:tetratricopeptide (TPR) repeat protein